MNDQTRARLLQALEELGRRFPDWRFGQLVENVAGWADANVWDAEDEQLLTAARHCLDKPRTPADVPEQQPSPG